MVSLFLSLPLVRKQLSRIAFGCILVFISLGCSPNSSDDAQENNVISGNEYARSFSIAETDTGTLVNIFNPWQGASNAKLSYCFSSKSGLANAIHVPVKRVACFSSSHTAFISALDKQENIIGISGVRFISDSTIQQQSKAGMISEIGYEENIDYDFFIKNKPDLALVYGVGEEHARFVTRLRELGIPVMYISEYLESHPLGRLEWIKVFGILFDCRDKADSVYQQRKTSYLTLKTKAETQKTKPLIFSGSPVGDVWYVPGGNSFMSVFIADAGGKFIYNDNEKTESLPMSFEKAYQGLSASDIWLNCDIALDLTELSAKDERYTRTLPYRNGRVYNNAGRVNSAGGNDFWESAVVNPDKVLNDLVQIFYPEKTNKQPLYYFRKL